MKIICQIGVIFAVCWFSQLIEAALPVPFPASVIGMLLLLALLATGLLKIEHIREKADFRNIILLTKRMRVADDTTTGMYQFILFFHICVFDLGMFKQPFFV